MREYKFRAWLSGENMYAYSDKDCHTCAEELLIWSFNSEGKIEVGYITADTGEYIALTTDVESYTGLKDKNGKEIYDGDILKVPDLYETPENTSMTYHNEVIDFKNFTFNLGDSPLGDDYEYVSDECEVIGSIHDNPELLEV